MIVLGLDIGDVRTGLAVSDEEGVFAFERGVIETKTLIANFLQLELEYGFKMVVAGLPLNMKGEETAQTKKVKDIIDQLKKGSAAEFVYRDERFTSKMVSKLPGGSIDIDSMSAKIILQNYLNEKNHSSQLEA